MTCFCLTRERPGGLDGRLVPAVPRPGFAYAAHQQAPLPARDTWRAMSRENVEIVRSSLDAWNRGDVDAFLASAHPDIEFRPSGAFLGLDPIYRGHAELRHFWDVFHEPWASIEIRTDQVREVADQVVPLGMFQGHAREGMTVRREVAWTWQFVGNLYVRVNAYSGWNEALEAVGLSE